MISVSSGLAKPRSPHKSQVCTFLHSTSVGSLSLRERAGVRVAVYPQCLLVDLWITCSPLPTSLANQALQPSGQKTTSLSHGFFGLFSANNSTSCPQSLLALLWIRCSLSAVGHMDQGLHGFDQLLIKCAFLAPRAVNVRGFPSHWGFPQVNQSCPRSLLALLWITCSLPAGGLGNRGLHGVDQKTTDRFKKP